VGSTGPKYWVQLDRHSIVFFPYLSIFWAPGWINIILPLFFWCSPFFGPSWASLYSEASSQFIAITFWDERHSRKIFNLVGPLYRESTSHLKPILQRAIVCFETVKTPACRCRFVRERTHSLEFPACKRERRITKRKSWKTERKKWQRETGI
jgi:hypothetical protein